MVTGLSVLTNLEFLTLSFLSPSSRPDRRSQPPLLLTRIDLPALTKLEFQGISECLEDFLAQINTPVLTATKITFFNRVIFDIPQLFNFISRTEVLGSVK
jgi:Leucine-rich repeat (LRR) protein